MTATDGAIPAVAVALALACSFLAGPALAQAGSASFDQDAITEHRGDVVEATVSLSGTDVAYVQVGTADSDYNATVRLHDGGDGTVALTFDTYHAVENGFSAGWGLAPESEADGDEVVTVRMREPPANETRALPLGDHEVRVGTEVTDEGLLAETQDAVTVTLEERSLDGIRLMTAPYDAMAFTSRGEFRDRFPSPEDFLAHATPADRVAVGDYLVVEVDAAGIYDQVDDRYDLLGYDARGNATGLFLAIREMNAPPTRAPHLVDYVHRDHLLFVAPEHEALYLFVDTKTAEIQPDTVYEAVFEINATNELVDGEREVAKATFVVDDREATVDTPDGSGELEVAAGTNATITGETSLAPRTQVAVTLAGASTDVPVSMTRTANVTANRTFAATFDLAGVPAGATLTATVAHGDDSLAGETNVTVVEPRAADGEATAATATASPATTEEPTTEEHSTTASEPATTETSEATTTQQTTANADAEDDADAQIVDDAAGNAIRSPGQPGFGAAAALVAVLGAVALLAYRRE
jgi:PGF-CTERM protein